MKTFVTVAVIALVLVAGDVQSLNAEPQALKDNRRFSSGMYWAGDFGPFRLSELSCLGLPPGHYFEAVWWDGWSRVDLDGVGRLHVATKGTYSWAIFPYEDDIEGPYDTQHERLYFGSTNIDFRQIIDPYELDSYWSYYGPPSLVVSGVNGTFTLVSRPSGPGGILVLYLSDVQVGHPNTSGGIAGSLDAPVCAANQ